MIIASTLTHSYLGEPISVTFEREPTTRRNVVFTVSRLAEGGSASTSLLIAVEIDLELNRSAVITVNGVIIPDKARVSAQIGIRPDAPEPVWCLFLLFFGSSWSYTTR